VFLSCPILLRRASPTAGSQVYSGRLEVALPSGFYIPRKWGIVFLFVFPKQHGAEPAHPFPGACPGLSGW